MVHPRVPGVRQHKVVRSRCTNQRAIVQSGAVVLNHPDITYQCLVCHKRIAAKLTKFTQMMQVPKRGPNCQYYRPLETHQGETQCALWATFVHSHQTSPIEYAMTKMGDIIKANNDLLLTTKDVECTLVLIRVVGFRVCATIKILNQQYKKMQFVFM